MYVGITEVQVLFQVLCDECLAFTYAPLPNDFLGLLMSLD